MRTKPDHWYVQSAVAPVQEAESGLEVLLVTSLKKKRWILPKGIVEPGMTAPESAAKEAWEEAGVKGEVGERSLGHYSTRKWGGVCRVDVFRLDVTTQASEWLESERRERRWFPVEEAAGLQKSPEAARILRRLALPKLMLTVVRHAKAARDPSLTDFDRPLTARGKEDAARGAEFFAGSAPKPCAIVTSPAKRALKTAKAFAKALEGSGAAIEERPEVYDAEVTGLLAQVRDLPGEWGHVVLVGHNPGLSELVRTLTGKPVEELPTTGVARLSFEAVEWSAIEPGGATLVSLWAPAAGEE